MGIVKPPRTTEGDGEFSDQDVSEEEEVIWSGDDGDSALGDVEGAVQALESEEDRIQREVQVRVRAALKKRQLERERVCENDSPGFGKRVRAVLGLTEGELRDRRHSSESTPGEKFPPRPSSWGGGSPVKKVRMVCLQRKRNFWRR